MKRQIQFKDAENNLFKIDVELRRKEDGKEEFSASGEWGNSCGQCLDEIKPANEFQKRLVELWHKYHLNGMNAGTEKQEEALKKWREKNKIEGWAYDDEVKYLKSIKLYEDKGYKYGSSWLYRELPIGFKRELIEVCDKIEQIEADKKKNLNGGNWEEIEDPKIIALGISLDISPKEAQKEISNEGDNVYNYAGIDYFVGDDDEAKEECRNYLNKDLWIDSIKADRTELSFEEWQDWVIESDGYGQILNSWDGSEEFEEVNGVYYYIIRR